jgi:hypothetical protein
MPLSLADRILSYRDPGGRRGGLRRAPQDEAQRESGQGPVFGFAPDAGEAARMRGLFGDVSRDWCGLVGAVGDLRKALVGSPVEQAIGAAGVRAAVEPDGVGRWLQRGGYDALTPPGPEEPR